MDACATKRFTVMIHEIKETWYEVNAKNEAEAAAKAKASAGGHKGRAVAARKVKRCPEYFIVSGVISTPRTPHQLRTTHATRMALKGAA
jgi:site-specific recombinase XerC